ncbi:YncE family protein [Deinococcus aquatilis]|uniref:YncE family protein n=1 Tax=Deinococcus aquatilis TaxID=519440 RepID=UPI00037C61A5|nr:YncE family protein [Deinococcus aquatilis]
MFQIHRPVLITVLAISLTGALALAQQARGGGAQGVAQQPPALNGPALSARDRVYTADQTSNTVTVINPATNAVIGQIPLGHPRPGVLGALDDMQVNVHGLGFSPDGRYLDVISNASNGVTIIRTRDNTVMGTVYIGRGPHEGFFTPDGQQVWVTVRGEDYLSVIDVASMKEVDRIRVAGGPGMVVFSPDGRRAFVDSSRTAQLDVIDVQTRKVIARVPVVSAFSPNLVVTPDGKEVWLTHKDVGKVSVIDARTFKVLHVLDTGKVTNHVNAVTTKAGDFIYVTVGGEDVVKVIKRGPQPQIVATIPTGFTPHGLWPSGDNTRVYVGLEDQDAVDVIDTASNTVITTIPIGQMPQALVYVANAVPSGPGTQNLKTVRVGLPSVKIKLGVPDKPFAFLPAALKGLSAQVIVRSLEGTDDLTLKAEGLTPGAQYNLFLTESAVAPFGMMQHVLDFKADAKGKAEASAMTSVFDAFTLRGTAKDGKPDGAAIKASKVNLDHLVVWPKDPQTTAKLFANQGQPYAVSPFDTDLEAGPAILSDSNSASANSPLTR